MYLTYCKEPCTFDKWMRERGGGPYGYGTFIGACIGIIFLGVSGYLLGFWLVERFMGGKNDMIRRNGGSVLTAEPVSCVTGWLCPTCLLASSVSTARGGRGLCECLPLCLCLTLVPCVGCVWSACVEEDVNQSWGGDRATCYRCVCVSCCTPCHAAQVSRAVAVHAASSAATVAAAAPTPFQSQKDDPEF